MIIDSLACALQKKRRKRGPNVVLGRFGGYDVNDPFVDDEEVALYEVRHVTGCSRFRNGR